MPFPRITRHLRVHRSGRAWETLIARQRTVITRAHSAESTIVTAKDFATLINAQPIGPGRWKAPCPAHPDRSPSFYIREGSDENCLIKCFAGCSTDAILAALKLSRRDLFAGPPPSPEKLAEMRAEQEKRETDRQRLAAERRDALDRVDRIQLVINSLGAKLARTPDDAALADAFHASCDALHKAGQTMESIHSTQRDAQRGISCPALTSRSAK
jgi:hypothetical protein